MLPGSFNLTLFSYGNLLFVAAGLMIFVTISAVLAGGGVASALFWGVPTVIILLIAIVCKNKGV